MNSPDDGAVTHWGAQLAGHEFDLLDWEDELRPPFDPWVERINGMYILRSEDFDVLTNSTEAHARAEVLIERLNGAMAAARTCRPLHLNSVVQFDPDGRRQFHVLVAATAEGRARAVAVGQAGATTPSIKPKQSKVQAWLRIANRDDRLSDALVHLGKGGWFELYKAMECIEHSVGGKRQLMERGWIEPDKLERVKKTADALYRHHRGRMTPPSVPATIEEACLVVAELISKAFEVEDS